MNYSALDVADDHNRPRSIVAVAAVAVAAALPLASALAADATVVDAAVYSANDIAGDNSPYTRHGRSRRYRACVPGGVVDKLKDSNDGDAANVSNYWECDSLAKSHAPFA